MSSNQDLALNPNQDLTPNQITDLSTRIRKAKEFLQENPDEQTITVAWIYNIGKTTLRSSISRRPAVSDRGRQNKILQEHQQKALHQFIQSLLACQIQSTYQLIFNAICNLKHAQNLDSDFKAPSLGWFSGWWKMNDLHKIKTKPLAVICLTAQWEEEIIQWFRRYQATIKKYGIKRKNIMNFDEADFHVGCSKGQYLLVPIDILEVCFWLNCYIDCYIISLHYIANI